MKKILLLLCLYWLAIPKPWVDALSPYDRQTFKATTPSTTSIKGIDYELSNRTMAGDFEVGTSTFNIYIRIKSTGSIEWINEAGNVQKKLSTSTVVLQSDLTSYGILAETQTWTGTNTYNNDVLVSTIQQRNSGGVRIEADDTNITGTLTLDGNMTNAGTYTQTGGSVINFDSSTDAFLQLDRSAISKAAFTSYRTTGVTDWVIGLPDSDSTWAGGSEFAIGKNGSDQPKFMINDTNYYVGIGTTNPSSLLHVNGTITADAFSGNGASVTNVNATTLDSIDSTGFGILAATQTWTAQNTHQNTIYTSSSVVFTAGGITWADGTQSTSAATGNGDMLKSVYDTDANDIVDNAETLDLLDSTAFAQLTATQTFTGQKTYERNVDFSSSSTHVQLQLKGNMETQGQWISGDGGAEGIQIDSSGNVGIGTASPVEKLDVEGTFRVTDKLEVTASSVTIYGISEIIISDAGSPHINSNLTIEDNTGINAINILSGTGSSDYGYLMFGNKNDAFISGIYTQSSSSNIWITANNIDIIEIDSNRKVDINDVFKVTASSITLYGALKMGAYEIVSSSKVECNELEITSKSGILISSGTDGVGVIADNSNAWNGYQASITALEASTVTLKTNIESNDTDIANLQASTGTIIGLVNTNTTNINLIADSTATYANLYGTQTFSGGNTFDKIMLRVTTSAYISGNLGIGTDNAAEKLDVEGTFRVADKLEVTASSVTIYGRTEIIIADGGSPNVNSHLTIEDNDGISAINILSGTGSNDYPYLMFGHANDNFVSGMYSQNSSSNIVIVANNSDAIYIDANQNMGIGVSNPTSKLDVVGDFEVKNYFTVDSTGSQVYGDLKVVGQVQSNGNKIFDDGRFNVSVSTPQAGFTHQFMPPYSFATTISSITFTSNIAGVVFNIDQRATSAPWTDGIEIFTSSPTTTTSYEGSAASDFTIPAETELILEFQTVPVGIKEIKFYGTLTRD